VRRTRVFDKARRRVVGATRETSIQVSGPSTRGFFDALIVVPGSLDSRHAGVSDAGDPKHVDLLRPTREIDRFGPDSVEFLRLAKAFDESTAFRVARSRHAGIRPGASVAGRAA